MPEYLYVALVEDAMISVLTIDPGSGRLSAKAKVPVSGGPSALAISPDRNVLYAGHRDVPEISSWRIDHNTGGLTKNGSVSPESAAGYLSLDRKGRYLLSSYYQAGHPAVHPLRDEGAVGSPPTEWPATDIGAHAIQTDPSNGLPSFLTSAA